MIITAEYILLYGQYTVFNILYVYTHARAYMENQTPGPTPDDYIGNFENYYSVYQSRVARA